MMSISHKSAGEKQNSPRLFACCGLIFGLAIALAMMVGGCKGEPEAEKKSDPSTDTPDISLTASPNPVPAGSGLGKTTLTWYLRDKRVTQIFVSLDGGPERLVVEESPGSKEIDWIQENVVYEFRMYEGKEHKKRLATLKVTRK